MTLCRVVIKDQPENKDTTKCFFTWWRSIRSVIIFSSILVEDWTVCKNTSLGTIVEIWEEQTYQLNLVIIHCPSFVVWIVFLDRVRRTFKFSRGVFAQTLDREVKQCAVVGSSLSEPENTLHISGTCFVTARSIRELQQGAWRMRGLAKGQSLEMLLPEDGEGFFNSPISKLYYQ